MRTSVILRAAVTVAAVTVAIVVAYMVRENRGDAQFTAELQRLQKTGPDVVVSGTTLDDMQIREKLAAIQRIYRTHNDGWCHGDATLYASVFTEDADFVSFDGSHTSGRSAIQASHQELFERYLTDTCLDGQITRVKFLNPHTALVHVVSGTRFGGGLVRRASIQTYVAVEQNGEWRFSGFHNGRIDRIQDRPVLRQAWLGFETFVLRR